MTTMPILQMPCLICLHVSLRIWYLTNCTSLANGMFQYTSQLSIEKITVDSANVTCTVTSDPINMTDTDVRSLSLQISGK